MSSSSYLCYRYHTEAWEVRPHGTLQTIPSVERNGQEPGATSRGWLPCASEHAVSRGTAGGSSADGNVQLRDKSTAIRTASSGSSALVPQRLPQRLPAEGRAARVLLRLPPLPPPALPGRPERRGGVLRSPLPPRRLPCR